MTDLTPSQIYDTCASQVDWLNGLLNDAIRMILYDDRPIEAGIRLEQLTHNMEETSNRWYERSAELEKEESE